CCTKHDGTMCHAVLVTLDGQQSTRARANLMRESLSGKLPANEFTGKELHDTLDLCLECKGCKAECPSNVDMAKLKYEFLAHYNEANGVPLRSRLFANIHAMSKAASIWPSMANWTLTNPTIRRALDRFIGIDARRKLPAFAPQTFESWFAKRGKSRNAHSNGRVSAGKVVFFHDTFIDYNY